ncbi:MAG: hypothetical protein JWQ14_3129, partial [Adhaeribacter sp.]|nr:hypothetical protein [Adhaeribacter sp.]
MKKYFLLFFLILIHSLWGCPNRG